MKPLKVCVIGTGAFSKCFIPLYQSHPLVGEVSLADNHKGRLDAAKEEHGIQRGFESFEDVLKSDVDAVAIFTQRWTHAPLALAALRAGKHVYSAVPAATTLTELDELTAEVKRTGLTYMMGETSLYYGSRLFCKEKWDAGKFGDFVYGEGEYYHDMSHGFYEAFESTGGPDWKQIASYPPMLYPTHSVSMVLSITGARATSVSCLGWTDRTADGVFVPEVSRWQNAFSNQSALFRTSDGGIMRINEFRRVGQSGGRSVRLSIYGTEGSFEEQTDGAIWTDRKMWGAEKVEDEVFCDPVFSHEQWMASHADNDLRKEFVSRFGKVHEKYRSRLPKSYAGQVNGHEGSHQFLTDDFLTSIESGRRPTCSVWDAARFNAPGIVAHESSNRDGESLTIPDYTE